MRRLCSLKSQKDFDNVFKKGRWIESPCFRTKCLPNRLSYDRVAFVAAKYVAKEAVVRNKLRRRTREWIRKKVNLCPSKPQDIIIFFKKEAVSCARTEFYAELEKQLKKIYGQIC